MTYLYLIISALAMLLFIVGIVAIVKGIKNRRERNRIRSGTRTYSVRNFSQAHPVRNTSQVYSARNSPAVTARRMPHRSGNTVSLPVHVNVLRAPASRVPHRTFANDFLKYRKCPRCHTENTLAQQYIFKTGEHSYHCTRCDHRFNF